MIRKKICLERTAKYCRADRTKAGHEVAVTYVAGIRA